MRLIRGMFTWKKNKITLEASDHRSTAMQSSLRGNTICLATRWKEISNLTNGIKILMFDGTHKQLQEWNARLLQSPS